MLTKNKYWLNFLHRIAVWLHLFLPNTVRKSCLLFKSKCSEWLSTDKQIARNKIHPSPCDMSVLWKAVQWFLWRAAVDIKHFSRPFFRHVATSLRGNLLREEAETSAMFLTFLLQVENWKMAKIITIKPQNRIKMHFHTMGALINPQIYSYTLLADGKKNLFLCVWKAVYTVWSHIVLPLIWTVIWKQYCCH